MLGTIGVFIKIIWLLVLALLVIAEIMFCIKLQELLKLHKKIKKEYALASNDGYNGHSGRLMKDIENDLVNLRIKVISWVLISAANTYAILDCFITHIIK